MTDGTREIELPAGMAEDLQDAFPETEGPVPIPKDVIIESKTFIRMHDGVMIKQNAMVCGERFDGYKEFMCKIRINVPIEVPGPNGQIQKGNIEAHSTFQLKAETLVEAFEAFDNQIDDERERCKEGAIAEYYRQQQIGIQNNLAQVTMAAGRMPGIRG